MTTIDRQQSLAAARDAAHFLKLYIQTEIVGERLRAEIGCLLDEFERLDAKEQAQIAAGAKGKEYGKLGAKHGKKGGRPRKTNGGKK
jgi:hypothetical protein